MIAVFGASGYIGSHLVNFLIKKKITFVLPSNYKSKGFTFIKDFTSDSIKSFIKKYKVKTIINLHAQTNIEKSFDDLEYDYEHNVHLTISILNSIKNLKINITYIFIGTATQVGFTRIKKSISLKHISSPLTVFDLNKQYCEDLIKIYKKKFNINAFTLRLSNVFGPGKKVDNNRGIINKIINNAININEVTVYGNGGYVRDFIYIDDVVKAIYLAIKFKSKLNENHYYYVSSGKGISFFQFVNQLKFFIYKNFQKSLFIKFKPWPKNTHPIDKRSFVGNNKSFKNITGWNPEKNLLVNFMKYINNFKQFEQ